MDPTSIDYGEVEELLKKFKEESVLVPGAIPYRILIECFYEAASALTDVFQLATDTLL